MLYQKNVEITYYSRMLNDMSFYSGTLSILDSRLPAWSYNSKHTRVQFYPLLSLSLSLTCMHAYRQTDGQKDRHTYTQTDIHIHVQTYIHSFVSTYIHKVGQPFQVPYWTFQMGVQFPYPRFHKSKIAAFITST